MLPRSDPKKRIHPDCPPDIWRAVNVALAVGIARQPMLSTDTVGDVVKRVCPEIFDIPAAVGFELRFDMPENTHCALLKGKVFYQIRRKPAH
jgi:hypothetical protein